MKFKYYIKIHTVAKYDLLEKLLNEYAELGMRVIKIEQLDDVDKCMRFVLYLEEKIKKTKYV